MLDSLLTGPSNFNMFGAVFPARLSRLYGTSPAKSWRGRHRPAASIDPLLPITIVMHLERTVDEVLRGG